jgi:hypothetical protein
VVVVVVVVGRLNTVVVGCIVVVGGQETAERRVWSKHRAEEDKPEAVLGCMVV